jgi:Spy/CpxP family protein refolding chaperone
MDMRRRQAIGVGVATSLAVASGLSAAAASETGPKFEPQDAWPFCPQRDSWRTVNFHREYRECEAVVHEISALP